MINFIFAVYSAGLFIWAIILALLIGIAIRPTKNYRVAIKIPIGCVGLLDVSIGILLGYIGWLSNSLDRIFFGIICIVVAVMIFIALTLPKLMMTKDTMRTCDALILISLILNFIGFSFALPAFFLSFRWYSNVIFAGILAIIVIFFLSLFIMWGVYKSRFHKEFVVILIIILLTPVLLCFYMSSTVIWAGGKAAPEITATCERYGDDYVIVMESVQFGAGVQSMKYFITDNQIEVEDYSNYSGSDGLCTNHVDEIYGADLTFQNEDGNPISNVSFYDSNLDGKFSAGDFFVIRGVNNSDIYNNKGERVSGVGKEGLVFNLIFAPTGETICSITLFDASPITNKTIPKTSNRFTINPATVPKTPNLNISTSEPVSSASPSLYGYSIMIAVTVCNNDTMNVSDISVKFFDNGGRFYSKEYISIETGDEIRVLTYPYYLEENGIHNITVEVMVPEWDTPIQANASTIGICAPPLITQSFEVNPFGVLFAVLVVSLLSAILRKRKV
ncbi:MAG: hypothetical protein KJ886_02525 [Candidatus Thermoplasmatota archaeon]|nr:hypothetical protein [Candidatus Thermoplasmatota archaeon]MBU4255764.1 hypothetical protein [Candidatus Thermoplasmatota archaeon]MCG2827043.1 hypothetical protein [Thermoplasmatales archaeon]